MEGAPKQKPGGGFCILVLEFDFCGFLVFKQCQSNQWEVGDHLR